MLSSYPILLVSSAPSQIPLLPLLHSAACHTGETEAEKLIISEAIRLTIECGRARTSLALPAKPSLVALTCPQSFPGPQRLYLD